MSKSNDNNNNDNSKEDRKGELQTKDNKWVKKGDMFHSYYANLNAQSGFFGLNTSAYGEQNYVSSKLEVNNIASINISTSTGWLIRLYVSFHSDEMRLLKESDAEYKYRKLMFEKRYVKGPGVGLFNYIGGGLTYEIGYKDDLKKEDTISRFKSFLRDTNEFFPIPEEVTKDIFKTLGMELSIRSKVPSLQDIGRWTPETGPKKQII